MADRKIIIAPEQIEGRIFLIRGQKVMLDATLAELYEVEVKVLNQAVKRNIDRFPTDFMFQLSTEETAALRSQFVTSNTVHADHLRFQSGTSSLKSQSVTSKRGSGGRRYRPYVFTEQGVAMLSSVLRSKRAVMVNVEIMRTFVRLRQMLTSNAELARKLAALEKKYDAQFKVVFDAIRELMTPPERKKRSIGFAPWEDHKL